jgi:hypothetical protein
MIREWAGARAGLGKVLKWMRSQHLQMVPFLVTFNPMPEGGHQLTGNRSGHWIRPINLGGCVLVPGHYPATLDPRRLRRRPTHLLFDSRHNPSARTQLRYLRESDARGVAGELAAAERVGVTVTSPGSASFDAAVSGGTVKGGYLKMEASQFSPSL